MMKFFALVALAVFATANASSLTSVAATRGSVATPNLVAGATTPNLVLTLEASGTGEIVATTGTITIQVNGAIFAGNGDAACTATSTVGGVAQTAPTFAGNKGTVSGFGTNTEQLLLTMGGGGTDKLDNSGTIVITCDSNLLDNAAAVTTYTFSVETSGDATSKVDGSYTLKTTATTFTASRGTGATNLMTGMTGGDLTFGFTPTTALASGETITLTPRNAADDAGVDLFTASSADGGGATGATTCTATVVDAATPPTFASGIVSGAAGSQVLTLTLGTTVATDIVAATKAATIVCTDNLAVNTAAAAIKFNLETATDLNPMGAQTGYTIGAKTVTAFSAGRGSLVPAAAGGDLTFTFTPTTNLPSGETITLTPSVDLFTASSAGTGTGATTCTATVVDATTPPTFASGIVSGAAGAQVLTLTLGTTVATDKLTATKATTIVCTDNLAVNTAAGAVTFTIATTQDTALAGQTGYTLAAATSAASSTASVSMLTMLALAAVAMRQ